MGASRLVSAGRGSTSGSGRCPSAFRGPPPLMLPGAALGSLAARFCWQGQHFRLWTVPERVSGPPPLDAARRSIGSLAARFCWQGQHFRLWTVPERVSGPPPLMLPGAPRGSFLLAGAALQALDGTRARFGAPPLDAARRSTWQHFRLWTVPERVSGPPLLMLPGAALGRCPSAFRGPPLDAARRSTWEPRGSGSGLVAARTHVDTHIITIEIGSPQAVSATAASTCF